MLPGQFPGEELYNLDFRDEEDWYLEAVRKQLEDELRLLQSINLGSSGKDQYVRRQQDIITSLAELRHPGAIDEIYVENWKNIRAKGPVRGRR